MRIFLTGASGFIGSRILPALQASGHKVIGLARSESTAQALKAAGAEVHRGTLDAPESLLAGVGNADAVIHPPSTTTSAALPLTARKTARRSWPWARRCEAARGRW